MQQATPNKPAATRRSMLTAALALPAVTLPASCVAAIPPSPDALLLERAAAFMADELDKEARTVRFYDLAAADWTEADHAEYDGMNAFATGYHDRIAEISEAEPTTPEGMVAKATCILWHERSANDPHGFNLALSVLAFFGASPPAWAEEAEA